jgi:hypothetical protein
MKKALMQSVLLWTIGAMTSSPVLSGEVLTPNPSGPEQGREISKVIDGLTTEGWKQDPHIYDGPELDSTEGAPHKQWFLRRGFSSVVCWNEAASRAIDRTSCWLSFVKQGKRVQLKSSSGDGRNKEKNWPGPVVLEWANPADMPLELIKIQPGMQLSTLMRLLNQPLNNGRHWTVDGSPADCKNDGPCRLKFVDRNETEQITNLEVELGKPSGSEELIVKRASVWYGGGT